MSAYKLRFIRTSHYRTYEVLADGEVIGRIKKIGHDRRGDRWKAYGLDGKEVCEARFRHSAAEGLLDAIAWSA